MKIKILAVIGLLAGTLPSAALDFGLNLGSVTALYGGETSQTVLRQKASLWFTSHSDIQFLQINGFYEFAAQFMEQGYALEPYKFDLGLTSWTRLLPLGGNRGVVSLSLGRLESSSPSDSILSGLMDGGRAELKIANWSLGFLGGYTGFLGKKTANIILTPRDYDRSKDLQQKWAPPKVLAGVTSQFLEILDRQDMSLGAYAQFDLEAGGLNSQWIELVHESRPVLGLKTRAYATLQVWNEAEAQFSLASGYRIQGSLPVFSSLILVHSLDWASGTALGLRQYSPFNQRPLGEVFLAPFADILTPKLYGIFAPLPGLRTGASASAFFRTTGNKPADPYFPLTATSLYLGTEVQGFSSWSPWSDLTLSLKGSFYLPNTAPDAYPLGSPLRYNGTLEVGLSL